MQHGASLLLIQTHCIASVLSAKRPMLLTASLCHSKLHALQVCKVQCHICASICQSKLHALQVWQVPCKRFASPNSMRCKCVKCCMSHCNKQTFACPNSMRCKFTTVLHVTLWHPTHVMTSFVSNTWVDTVHNCGHQICNNCVLPYCFPQKDTLEQMHP